MEKIIKVTDAKGGEIEEEGKTIWMQLMEKT